MKRVAIIACLFVALFALAAAESEAEFDSKSKDPIDTVKDGKVDEKSVKKDLKDAENTHSDDKEADVADVEEVPVPEEEDAEMPEDMEMATADVSEDENEDESLPAEEEEEDLDVDEDVQESRHGKETKSIRKLLNAIKAKLRRELNRAKSYVGAVARRENKRVARAHRAFKMHNVAMSHAINSRNRALGALRSAQRRRVQRIRAAKKHQIGVIHRRERELLLIHSIECRLYALTGNGKLARKCHKNYLKRLSNHHARWSTRGIRSRTYSGYCSRHSRGGGWARYCTNRHEFNQAGRYLKVRSNGVFTAKVSGYFRLHFRTIQYCANWGRQHLRTIVNGRQVNYSYKNHQHSWTQAQQNMVYYVRRGQNFHFQAYCGSCSNPYRWHSGNHRGAHSRVQVTFLGAHQPTYSATCSRSRGRGWHRYCTNRLERTNSHFFSRRGDGVRVKRSGMYRINVRSIIYTRGWGPHHARAHVNGRQVSYTHDYNVYWGEHRSDVMWPLNKNDRITADFYSNNGHAYHSGNSHGTHSRFQVTYEGPKSMPVVSAGCSHHSRGRRSWRTYCLNRREFNTAGNHLRVHGSGQIDVLRSGTYRINAWALQHTGGYTNRNSRVLINGSYWDYSYTHAHSWNRLGHDFVWRLKRGQKLHVQYYVGGGSSPYSYHSGMTHSRLQIAYAGSY